MTTLESAITSKGQATIPKAIRDYLHVRPGDRIKFFMHPDGGIYILPKLPASALRGMLRRPKRAATIEEMDEAIAAGAAQSVTRPKRR
jgi:antitoxin PrlF